MIKIDNKQAAQIYGILSNEETSKVEKFFDKIGNNFYGEDYNEVMNNITKAIEFMKEFESYKEMLNSTNMELRKYQMIIKSDVDKVVEESNNRREGAKKRWSDETQRQQHSEKIKAAWERRKAAMSLN